MTTPKEKKKKEVNMFDVLSAMPETSTAIFTQMKGGKSIGRGKNPNAVIEAIVDNDTFQDFSGQMLWGESKSGRSKKYFMFLAIDADEYEKVRAKLNKK